ncbi:MAG: histidinol-phosphatase [Candidatus Nanopelagicales bacterium]|nr:histidinol-phosphatase [Candidatus Nanopelagicales bacterium]
MSESRAADLALALSMADLADAITMRLFRSSSLRVETKPDLTPVTEADQETERALRAALAAEHPGDSVLGEEFGTTAAASRRHWILDPIDGTKNYVRGVPVWATLIALAIDGEPVVGVVSAPALGRRWWAAQGAGAYVTELGGAPRRLQVSGVQRLADASFSGSDAVGWTERGAATGLTVLQEQTWRQRAYGDFWSHLLVAEGAVDIAAEPELGAWDMAALIPIVREAGGSITAFDGTPALSGGCAVTTNGLLHPEVLAALAS